MECIYTKQNNTTQSTYNMLIFMEHYKITEPLDLDSEILNVPTRKNIHYWGLDKLKSERSSVEGTISHLAMNCEAKSECYMMKLIKELICQLIGDGHFPNTRGDGRGLKWKFSGFYRVKGKMPIVMGVQGSKIK